MEATDAARQSGWRYRAGGLVLVLLASLSLTLLAWHLSVLRVEERAGDRFRTEVEDASQRIVARIAAYEHLLRGGVALFAAGRDEVDRAAWRRYVDTLDIGTRFPGSLGLCFAREIDEGNASSLERAIRAEGYRDFAIHPAGRRGHYTVIDYVEPVSERTRTIIGFDIASDPVRRAAAEAARDTGRPAVSGWVRLLNAPGEEPKGFIMYLPVYRQGMPVDTVERRRAALLGYVYSAFRADELLNGILGAGPPDLGLEILDGRQPVFRAGGEPQMSGAFEQTVSIPLPGNQWMAHFYSRPSFNSAVGAGQPQLVLAAGLVIDALLILLFWRQVREERRVHRRAREMTRALRETATRLELAQESAGIGIWDRDLRNGAILWDPRMLAFYDIPPEEFDGSDSAWRRRVHPEDLARVDQARNACVKEGLPRFDTTLRVVHRDGRIHVLEAQGLVIRGEDGNAARVIGVTRDVTAQVEAQQALAEQHALLQSILDTIPDGVILKDENFVHRMVNHFILRFLGRTREEVIGKTDFDLFPPDVAARIRRDDTEVLRSGRSFFREQVMMGAAGPHWIEVIKVPQRDGEGRIVGVLTSARDVTEIKAVKRELQREQSELAAVFEATQAMIGVLDCNLRFLRVNPAFCSAVGQPAPELIGRSVLELFGGEEQEQAFRRVLGDGRVQTVVAWPFHHPEGGVGYWDRTLSPLCNEYGDVEGVLITAVDCTARETRRQEVEAVWTRAREDLERRVGERTHELRAAYRKLEVTNQELESFSYSVSHDLRAPLRAINGFTRALDEEYGHLLDETAHGYMARVEKATLRMSQLIEGLLNVSRIFRSPISPAPVNLSRMAHEIAARLQMAEPSRVVRFRIEPELETFGDPALLQALLENLLGNAWKFSARCTSAHIEFCRVPAMTPLTFQVRDNGAGFDMEFVDKLFKPFERLHGPGEFEGNGIGLATVRRIVERHGGSVWGVGEPGKGATIYFRLEATGTAEEEMRLSA